jgi:hypothetical protein
MMALRDAASPNTVLAAGSAEGSKGSPTVRAASG